MRKNDMKAIGYTGKNSIDNPDSFIAFEQQTPTPAGRDLLVKIQAVSVNPVDFKIRKATQEMQSPPKILGWDAAGIVAAVGNEVSLFKVGDKVFYAGDLTRTGSNATHQLVDERIVGLMPKSLDFTAAAALPLTSITAWEALFDRLKINPEQDTGKCILIIGGAGGVGSIAIQIAKQVAKLKVIATASRDVTRHWCQALGADHIVNHHNDMPAQFEQLKLAAPDYIFCLYNTDDHFSAMVELIAPQGMICSIVEAKVNHDIDQLKLKSAGFVWELMFTRSMFQTSDMIKQHELLNEIAELIDSGRIRTTLNEKFGSMTPENIVKAHKQLESGTSMGKIVLDVV
jgi:zinc-binding alcohol dehydrogenase family protein